jgi:adenylate cyclase
VLAALTDPPAFQIDTIPRVGYRLRTAPLEAEPLPEPSRVASAPPLPAKTSVAVLPFANLSNDPEQEYFVDGMVEEIVGALSRFKSLFVIGAGSGLALKGKGVGPQEAARMLGVRYVLEGSVRKSASQMRISVRLIDAHDGGQIWSDRFDDTLADVFALQERVAQRVAGVLDPAIEDLTIERGLTRLTSSLNSYELYLRALSHFWIFRKEDLLQSIEQLDEALALDPSFGNALSQSAVCHRLMIDNGWADDAEAYRRRGLERAERALAVAPGDSRVLAQVAASLPGLEGSLERSVVLIDRAVELNPGSSFVWLISGTIRLRLGEPDQAAQHLETAMRLDPISRLNGLSRMYMAMARVQQGRFDEALGLYQSTAFRLPASHAVLAAIHGHRGQTGAARQALAEFEALSPAGAQEVARIWFTRPEHRRIFEEGLAGLA